MGMPETEARPGQPLGEDEDGTEHRDEALVASFVDALLAVRGVWTSRHLLECLATAMPQPSEKVVCD